MKQAPVSVVESPVADPVCLDVLSALKNIGFSARNAKAALDRSTEKTGFEAILKSALALLKKPDAKVLVG